ncbi:MAG TPA: NADH-ubiquinone oxidoreductase-F iron-sulfur binding region domain-containing protein [Candidatus Nanopelagicales bacterium]|nr:NADH-ubiquinone oxidoreductase-F iron-sulfur binding region domain-containing protein [Candidatus Nanopelagicales bacterium]
MSAHLRVAPDTTRVRLLDGAAVLPAHGTESLTGVARQDLAAHVAEHGSSVHSGAALIAELAAVSLTGRGGGHFPTATKWRAVPPGGTVVVNGAEGEPGCAKDAVLLQTRPHLVLDGLVAAIEAVGARDGVVWLHDGAHATARSVSAALAERAAAGLGDPPIRIVLAPDRYLSGEGTAIIRTLEGGPTLPRWVADPARPWSEGARPVLVNNTETLARAALVALHGSEAYEPTSLVTVVSMNHRAVLEIEPGTTLGGLVAQAWQSPDGHAPQAVLLGGYGGSWIAWRDAAHLVLDPEPLRAHGLSLGAGLVAPLPASACGIEESARLLRYLASQSAKQCGPCVFGLPAIAELAADLTAGRLGRSGRARLDRYVREVSGRGACRHPDGALRMWTSALTALHDDVRRHRRGRTCGAPLYDVLPLPEGAP